MSTTQSLWTSLLPADANFTDERIAVGAAGHRVEYLDGSTRLCATSGLWNVPLGYGNPAITDAVSKAMRDASYLSLFRAPHRYAADAADALIELADATRYERVIFSTSGGAANDIAMKLARQYWAQKGSASRNIVVGLTGSYHGTMYGGHALSGDDLMQAAYAVDRRSVRHVPYDDGGARLDTLLAREGSRVAAVVVEPVLGSGAYPVPAEFIERLMTLRDKYGFLIVADEVATGFGRTGRMFATDGWSVAPNVMILSKALTNGAMGAAAVLVDARVSREFIKGGWTFVHGETQAGTPACAAAILAVIGELRAIDVESTTQALGSDLRRIAEGLKDDGRVAGITGEGCFLGLELRHDGGTEYTGAEILDLVSTIADHGVLVQPGPSSIELIPAYGFSIDELEELEAALRSGLRQYADARP
ncbi:aspartate aminotransferase family protein [Microbacterium foliorum]|uniref:Adenosylmethionine-8-amino-7-oxononanoate aminotransferase n=1 Tax=Microbacterium foliorum TaxID=104336 RepID=A0A0F0KXK3_9MICO|nr:daptide-type RiPP biosynthesis aminotransferase [Microbacterium foliorum]AXL13487.1 aspartate aminotransferase family protein [Microbacterium foliorum]KJL25642.1 Adenosylmethionine-8-amino-7-oxononanoate aminotransferase [Microbacterium foliorum]